MNQEFFKGNRKNLLSSILDKKCFVILYSGESIRRSEDEDYDFQVNNNFYYLTGINQKNVYLVLLKDGSKTNEFLYIDEYDEMYEKWIGHRLNKKQASKISGIDVDNILSVNNISNDINKLYDKYKVIYLDENNTSCPITFSKKDRVINIYNNIVTLRMKKQPEEIKCFKKALKVTKMGIESLMRNAKEGMYEYQLESYFDLTIKQNGNRCVSFKTIAASGKNATTLHYSANNSKINENDLILFDLGCKDNGYCADITRTFPINGKFSLLQKTIYNIVLKANKAVFKAAHAGVSLKELQQVCIDSLANGCLKAKLIKNKEEIGKYYYHGVSHSIGLDTHDPYIKDTPLPINAIISNEPGLYFKEYGIGIRIEDDLLIKETHAINLSKDIIKSVKQIENYMMKNKEGM
ncbi:MAG: Xaa-Pro aminopeptidase [Erysipelotrichaceae bacterium]|nr:Xaa-Pro aminopeptidase [Erysipelotrichaceae bacterium]